MPLSSVGRASLSESEGPRFEAASGYQSCRKFVARGQGGYGPVCKTGETGSTPVRASNCSSGSNGQAPDFYSGLCGFESCLERQMPA